MDASRANELAAKNQLDFGDWMEITGIDLGEVGMYSVRSDGIRFQPNKSSGAPGWNDEQSKEAMHLAPDGKRYETEQRIKEENASQLELPCTPRELVEFVLEHDVSGDLHGLLPGPFIAAVYEQESRPHANESKDAGPGHLLAIAGLLELLLDHNRPRYTQGAIASAINTHHPDWRGASTSNLTKLFAEANAAAKDADCDAISKCEAREAASNRAKKRKLAQG